MHSIEEIIDGNDVADSSHAVEYCNCIMYIVQFIIHCVFSLYSLLYPVYFPMTGGLLCGVWAPQGSLQGAPVKSLNLFERHCAIFKEYFYQ